MKAPVFIAEDRTVHTGEEAARLLNQKNDAAAVDPTRGITRADRERWAEAQRYEHKTWMQDFRDASDDRNRTHADHFGGYEALRGMTFSHAIELGCGPFTNVRLIASIARIAKLDLLDPLIKSYGSHPNCTYPTGSLRIDGGAPLPATLHASSIEEFNPPTCYDLVVMVNVLEHCFDADAIFDRILQMSAPGAVFVFHDRYYGAATLGQTLREEYDAGHPLRIDRGVIDAFLAAHFEPMFSRTARFERHKWGGDRSYDGVYFIGRRSAS